MLAASSAPRRYKPFKPYTQLVRLGYRLTHPASMHHIARTLPYLNMESEGDVWNLYWQGRLRARTHNWLALRENAPETLFVVGSGPSMSEQNLEPLGKADCVLVNGAVALCKTGLVKQPYAAMIEDARFILEKGDMLRCLPKGTRLCLVGAAIQALGVLDPDMFEHFDLYFMEGFETPYGKPKRTLDQVSQDDYRCSDKAKLSLNLQQGHFGCGTVMYAGVQLGFHIRAKHMLLVGFDMTDFDHPRFYETRENAAWCGLNKALDARVLPAFELAANTAQEMGMSLVNCSHTSAIPRNILPFNSLLMPQSRLPSIKKSGISVRQ